MNVYLKAQSWCLDNNIKVYIVPIKESKAVFLEINDDGTLIKSPHTYTSQKDASDKIWDLYLYLYNKKNNKY
jgi:hypothetical protein